MKLHARCRHAECGESYDCSPGFWTAPLCSLTVWESRLTGMGYIGLCVGWGSSCASGNTEEGERKPTEDKGINFYGNPPDTFHVCEESVSCSVTWHL